MERLQHRGRGIRGCIWATLTRHTRLTNRWIEVDGAVNGVFVRCKTKIEPHAIFFDRTTKSKAGLENAERIRLRHICLRGLVSKRSGHTRGAKRVVSKVIVIRDCVCAVSSTTLEIEKTAPVIRVSATL